MASSAFNYLQQKPPLSLCTCNRPSSSSSLTTPLSFLCASHFLTRLSRKHPPFRVLDARAGNFQAKLPTKDVASPTKSVNLRVGKEKGSGFSSLRTGGEKVKKQSSNNSVSSAVDEKIENSYMKDKNVRKDIGFRKRSAFGSYNLCPEYKSGIKNGDSLETIDNRVVIGKMEKKPREGCHNEVKEKKIGKGSKRNKADPQEVNFRLQLDKCCKRGDVMAAIQLYDLGQKEGINMGQYHYTVLLYLCSSAAAGVVQPAKSGRGGRASNSLEVFSEVSSASVGGKSSRSTSATEYDNQNSNNVDKPIDGGRHHRGNDNKDLKPSNVFYNLDNIYGEKNLPQTSSVASESNYQESKQLRENHDCSEIMVSEDVKRYALERGFEIYQKMCADKVPMNEATLTAVARIAMSMGNGDMAFDIVKQMKLLGLSPRLRSYGPALATFCSNGDVDKAFAVEKHMLEHGVQPEGPELEALLRVSVEAGKGDRVYYLLHKLRTSVRKVSPSTADIIVRWFKSKAASRVGKTKWDKRVVEEAIGNGGGGWHGLGWLGKGKWTMSCTSIGTDAFCKSCGEKLATIDLDPAETENFAESVASIAVKREKGSSFQNFQKWLDYYGPFEAVIDGANVGLLSQKRFVPSKINATANGIRQKLPSKKWPLIVLHNRRVTGDKMDGPANKSLVGKWKNADALYATPTGSNDDWYWLYAAIKFRCLIVTNDEMRDHTFQLLGNDFFPRWKERHQVHFGFSDAGPFFHMPPCFSVVIQESENGHWHIPIASDSDFEPERSWLCITRTKSPLPRKNSTSIRPEDGKRQVSSTAKARVKEKEDTRNHGSHEDGSHQQAYTNLRNILRESGFTDHCTFLSEIEAAEKLGNCVIDFEI